MQTDTRNAISILLARIQEFQIQKGQRWQELEQKKGHRNELEKLIGIAGVAGCGLGGSGGINIPTPWDLDPSGHVN